MVPEGESRESPSSALGREAEGTSKWMAGGLAWYLLDPARGGRSTPTVHPRSPGAPAEPDCLRGGLLFLCPLAKLYLRGSEILLTGFHPIISPCERHHYLSHLTTRHHGSKDNPISDLLKLENLVFFVPREAFLSQRFSEVQRLKAVSFCLHGEGLWNI